MFLHSVPPCPLADLLENQVFKAITEQGRFFVMLQEGIEMQPHNRSEYSPKSLVAVAGGMIVPMILGLILRIVIMTIETAVIMPVLPKLLISRQTQ
jgi:hypothetical protein